MHINVDLECSKSIGFPTSFMSIDSPTLRLRVAFFCFFSFRRQNGKETHHGWDGLFFGTFFLVSEIFSKYQRVSAILSPLGSMISEFSLEKNADVDHVSAKNMVFFLAVDPSCC